MKLKATKTSMYQLCKTFVPDMPSMKNVQFTKAYRTTSWWMEFRTTESSNYHKMFLSPCMGKPFLSDDWSEWHGDDEAKQRQVHTLTIDQLRSLNMIQD